MKNILDKLSNWKLLLPLFILFLIFPVVLFPYHQQRMAEFAGEEVTPLDSRFSYSYNEVKNDFEKLGVEGMKTTDSIKNMCLSRVICSPHNTPSSVIPG